MKTKSIALLLVLLPMFVMAQLKEVAYTDGENKLSGFASKPSKVVKSLALSLACSSMPIQAGRMSIPGLFFSSLEGFEANPLSLFSPSV